MITSNHPLQSSEWGEFRKKTGIQVVNIDGLQMTIHKIPHSPWKIGYIPKSKIPQERIISNLKKVGKNENCIFIQLEPNIQKNSNFKFQISNLGLRPAAHPLLTRYNIRVAVKHGVKIVEDNSDKAFETYLKLTEETTKRQGFYAHTKKYHKLMWETLKTQNLKLKSQNLNTDKLTAHLFLANYKPTANDQRPKTLVAWILFIYKDTLYFPYGASSSEHRETMASNLMMWEAILFGKKLGLKKFDMWGALGPNPDPKDPWFGFHRFKEGYGPT